MNQLRTLACLALWGVFSFLHNDAVAQNQSPEAATNRFDRTFFGLHVLRPFNGQSWRESGQGSVRLHDLNVAWRDLEPQRGDWRWQRLDDVVKVVRSTGSDIILPLQSTPTWASLSPTLEAPYGPGSSAPPANTADWDAYVSKVAQRYRGQITHYEIWNEPNLKKFFVGSPDDLAILTKRAAKIIKAVDPGAKIVCSGITGQYGLPWLNLYLRAGAGAACDVIGYHLYTKHNKPEVLTELVSGIRKVMSDNLVSQKPLWNTESGWLIGLGDSTDVRSAGFDETARILSATVAVEYVIRSHLIAKSLGVARFYWYAWDHASMGLTKRRGLEETAVSNTYTTLSTLLEGAKLESCTQRNGHWMCTVIKDGTQDIYAWTEGADAEITVQKTGRMFSFDRNGSLIDSGQVSENQRVQITGLPFIIRSTRN